MSWSDVYLFCFLVGAALSVFSFLAGAIHLHLPFNIHLPFNVHAPQVAHAHGASHGGGPHISWLNASTVLAFLAWFGGVGYLMTKYSHLQAVFVMAIATLAGGCAGWVVLRFLIKLVGPSAEPLRTEDRRVVGSVGTVSMAIRENGTGEVIFPLGGGRRCSGARTEDGKSIEKGAEVVIERYEKGIAYVKRWEEFVKS
jgi:hypothetical protein